MTSWTISQVAEKSGLSAHTLRWYERIGLLEQHRELVLASLAQQQACLRVLDRKIDTYRRQLTGPGPASTEGAAGECAPPTLVT